MKMTKILKRVVLARQWPTIPTDMGHSDFANISNQAPKNMHYALKSLNADMGCINSFVPKTYRGYIMLNHSEIYAGMSRRDACSRCRSSTQSVDKIGVTSLVAVSLIRQNLLQKAERMRTELTKRQSVLEPISKFETHRPGPNY